MIPAFDAGDESRGPNIANVAAADSCAGDTERYDSSSRHTSTVRSNSSAVVSCSFTVLGLIPLENGAMETCAGSPTLSRKT